LLPSTPKALLSVRFSLRPKSAFLRLPGQEGAHITHESFGVNTIFSGPSMARLRAYGYAEKANNLRSNPCNPLTAPPAVAAFGQTNTRQF
jgi:hypothetical protein